MANYYTGANANIMRAFAGEHLWTRPRVSEADQRSNYYEEQERRLEWGVDQAVARNLIDPLDAEEAKTGNERTWWDRMLGFNDSSRNMMGAIAQPIIDVLSLGNYAAAATTKATINDPLVQLGSLNLGFTPSAWLKAWKTRPHYSEMMDSMGGLVFDIGLDPTTYLTFGMGAGVKIGTSGIAKVGGATLKEGTQRLTLTRHGKDIYQLAARKFRPVFEEAAKKHTKEKMAAGLGHERLIPGEAMARLHDEVGKHMIDNYDSLALEFQQTMGAWQKAKNVVQTGIKKPVDALAESMGAGPPLGFKAEDMFMETARAGHVEYGIHNIKGIGARLGINPYVGKAFKAVAPAFHRKYGTPMALQDQWAITKNTIDRETSERLASLEERLGGLSDDKLKLVTEILEGGEASVSRHFSPMQDPMINVLVKDGSYIDDDVMEAAEFAKERFGEIFQREAEEVGFKVDSVKDYVSRYFKTRDSRQLIINRIVNDETKSQLTIKSGFQFHRTIASLEDSIEVFGQNAMETNIGAILAKRERQSIKAIHMEKFYDFVKSNYGIAPLMVYQAANEGRWVGAALKKMNRSQTPKENRIMDFDQVHSTPDSLHKKLGFIDEPGGVGAGKNIELLEYLAIDQGDRLGKLGENLRASVRPNATANVARQFQRTFKFKGQELDFIEIMKQEYSDAGIDIFNLATLKFAPDTHMLTKADLKTFIRALDSHTRKHLDAPLLSLFPDLMDRVREQAAKTSHLGKKKGSGRTLRIKGGEDVLRSIEYGKDGIRRPVNLRNSYEPQLPQEMELRAKMARQNYGDFTDTAKPNPAQYKKIAKLSKALSGEYRGKKDTYKKLGMQPSQMKELLQAMFNVDDISKISARQADKLIEFMALHADEYSTLEKSYIGTLWDSTPVKVTMGGRSRAHFEEMTDEVAASIKGAEDVGLQEVARKEKYANMTRQLESAKSVARGLRARVDGMQNVLKGDTAALEKAGGALEDVAQSADSLQQLQKQLAAAEKTVASISKARSNIVNPSRTPEIARDTRDYVSAKEILERNGAGEKGLSALTDAETEIINRRAGVLREKLDLRKVVDEKAVGPAKRIQSKLNRSLKAPREKLEELSKKRDELLEAGDSEAAKPLSDEIKKIEQAIDKQITEALKQFESPIKILSGGRYMDEGGRVRDILLRKDKNDKYHVMGRDAQKIKAAIISDAIRNGKSKVEFYRPALRRELPESIIGAPEGTYYLPESIAKFLQDINTPLYSADTDDFLNQLLRGYDRVQNMFKVPLLAPWLSTMFRNTVGNVSIAYLKAGMSLAEPEYLSDYFKTLSYAWYNESPTVRKLFLSGNAEKQKAKIRKLGEQKVRALGDDGDAITISELVDEMGRRGVFTGYMRDEVFDTSAAQVLSQRTRGAAAGAVIGGSVGGPIGAVAGTAVGALLKKEAFRMSNMFKFQELASEIPTRLMLAVHAYKQTGNFDEAGRVVRHFLHDYSELSVFERRVMRRIVPFYNFTKMAYRVFGTEVFEHPGRVLAPQKLFEAQNRTGFGGDERAMPEDVPDWFHSQMAFMGKDIDEESGKMKTWVYSGMNLPMQEVLQLTDILAPGGQPISQVGSRMGFLATSVAEYVLNYDTFRSGPIRPDVKAGIKQTQFESGKPFENSAEWLKTLVNYHVGDDGRARVNPTIAWVLGEVPTSRFVNVAKKIWQMNEEEQRELNYSHLATQVVGISGYRYDPETQQYFRNRKKVEAMTTLLANIQHLRSYSIDSATFNRPDRRRRREQPPAIAALAGEGPLR